MAAFPVSPFLWSSLSIPSPQFICVCPYRSPTADRTYGFTPTSLSLNLPYLLLNFAFLPLCSVLITLSSPSRTSLPHLGTGFRLKYKVLSWLGGSPLCCQAQHSAGSISHELRLSLSFSKFSLLAPDLTAQLQQINSPFSATEV